MNGGQPLKKVPWSVLIGANFQKVNPIDYAGDKRPYGISTNFIDGKVPENEVICVAFNCSSENTLISFKSAVTYNNLNDWVFNLCLKKWTDMENEKDGWFLTSQANRVYHWENGVRNSFMYYNLNI